MAAQRMIDKLTPVLDAAQLAMLKGEPGAKEFFESHRHKIERYQKQIDLSCSEDIPNDALCSLTPREPADNIVSKALKSRDDYSIMLNAVGYGTGRILRVASNSVDPNTVKKFELLMSSWSVGNGLPTWENITTTLELTHGVRLTRSYILQNPSLYETFDKHANRLLTIKFLKRDSSLRWYWNIEQATKEVFENWNFSVMGCPNHENIASQISLELPFMQTSAVALEKNRRVSEMLRAKKKELHDIGWIYCSSGGFVLSQRKTTPNGTEGMNIHECFTQLTEQWQISDGLPTYENITKTFEATTGFHITKAHILSDSKLKSEFYSLLARAVATGYIKNIQGRSPSWDFPTIINSIVSSNSTSDLPEVTFKKLLLEFPKIHLSYLAFTRFYNEIKKDH
ncbi:hypothetical protein D3M70_19310 [Pseudomonas sp. LS-2]|nr:hypothetical protein D3M70_19310 [Pseudomonas sp. LS-2]